MKLLDVVNAVEQLRVPEARQLAFQLGVSPQHLDDIDDEFRDSFSRKRRYIQRWLDSDLEASWKKLILALKQIDKNVLAAKVESEHPSPTALAFPEPAKMPAPTSTNTKVTYYDTYSVSFH